MLAMGGSQSPLHPANTASAESLGAAEINENIRLSGQETSRGGAKEDADVERSILGNVSQFQHQQQKLQIIRQIR